MAVHVLAYAVRIPGLTMPDLRGGQGMRYSTLRLGLVAAAVVLGAVLAVAALPLASHWANWAATFHGDG